MLLKKLKKITLISLAIQGVIFLLCKGVSSIYIIKNFSFSYNLCLAAITVGFFLVLLIVEKLYKSRKIIIMTISSIIIIFITFLFCGAILGIKKYLCSNQKFYNLNVEGITNEIILYEYNSFRSVSGELCFRVNDYIYEKISNTQYTIEAGYSLLDADNLVLSYNANNEELIMRYRWKENSKYTENIAILK